MRLLRRIIFDSLAALSLLLLLATAAFWARHRPFIWSTTCGFQTVALRSENSELTIKWITKRPPVPVNSLAADAGMHLQNHVKLAVDVFEFTDGTTWHGFGLYTNLINDPRAAEILPELSRLTMIALPHPFVICCAAILPLLWLADFRRRRQAGSPGHCAVCGYDLRATQERCPECGSKPTGPEKADSA